MWFESLLFLNLKKRPNFSGIRVVDRCGLAIGSTGTFSGGMAGDLARCLVFKKCIRPIYFNFVLLLLLLLLLLLPSQCAKVIISDCGIP